jgi:hypothetical protein
MLERIDESRATTASVETQSAVIQGQMAFQLFKNETFKDLTKKPPSDDLKLLMQYAFSKAIIEYQKEAIISVIKYSKVQCFDLYVSEESMHNMIHNQKYQIIELLIKYAIQINTNLGKPRAEGEECSALLSIGVKYFRVSDMLTYIVNQSSNFKDDTQDLNKMREDQILQLGLNVQNVMDSDDCARVLIEKDIYQIFIRNLRYGKSKVENEKTGT